MVCIETLESSWMNDDNSFSIRSEIICCWILHASLHIEQLNMHIALLQLLCYILLNWPQCECFCVRTHTFNAVAHINSNSFVAFQTNSIRSTLKWIAFNRKQFRWNSYFICFDKSKSFITMLVDVVVAQLTLCMLTTSSIYWRWVQTVTENIERNLLHSIEHAMWVYNFILGTAKFFNTHFWWIKCVFDIRMSNSILCANAKVVGEQSNSPLMSSAEK